MNVNDRVIVGVSAGPDSVALLCLLCECELDLTVLPVYVDHGLRPEESPEEIELIADLADSYQLEYQIASVNTLQHQQEFGSSLEESARLLRYEALQKWCHTFKAKSIAVAHTADDQAEEILLRLIRGTGLKGLSGMAMKNENIIRPLLATPKTALVDYLESNKIAYCTDSSNFDRSFLRNKVRLDLLPLITEHLNPSIRSTLLRTAEILKKDESCLDEITKEKLRICTYIDETARQLEINLELSLFHKEHTAIQRRIIEKILWQFSSRPSFKHIEDVLDLAFHGRNGAELHLAQGLRVYKSAEKLCFLQPQGRTPLRGSADTSKLHQMQLAPGKSYRLEALNRKIVIEELSAPPAKLQKHEILLDAARLVWPLTLRSSRAGERFSPQGMKGRKKISRFLSDQKIARRERSGYPVLTSNGDIVAIAGLRADHGYAPDSTTQEFVLVRWMAL